MRQSERLDARLKHANDCVMSQMSRQDAVFNSRWGHRYQVIYQTGRKRYHRYSLGCVSCCKVIPTTPTTNIYDAAFNPLDNIYDF